MATLSNVFPMGSIPPVPLSSRRKRPIQDATFEPEASSPKTQPLSLVEVLKGTTPYPKPVFEEAKVKFDYFEFFNRILPEINEHEFGEARFNKFLALFDPVKKESENLVFEGWIEKGESYLLVTILGDDYHSTTFKSDANPGKYLYIRISEWIESSNKLEADSVHLRVDPNSGEGEWMWVRRSPHFSGTEAKNIAANLSRLFLKEAVMWDTAKVEVQKKKLFLYRWNQLVKGNDGFFYTDKGFQVKDMSGVVGAEMTFTQSRGLRRSSVSYLKHVKLSDLSSHMTTIRAREFQKIIDRHQPEGEALANLAYKVEQAVREKKNLAQGDKLWLYALLSGEVPFKPSEESEKLSMAIKISARSLLLTAQSDFEEVLYRPDRSFSELYDSFQASHPDFPNDDETFIRWHLNQAS